MKAIKLRRAAGGRNHTTEENHIGSFSFDLFDHFFIVQAKRAAVEDFDIRGFFLSDERGDLRV
jgi:hypothetical protein